MMIETKGLTKVYRRFEKEPGLRGSISSLFHRKYLEKTAVDHLDFAVEPGELVGLIGPNGAGKTTLVKLLTGIVAPTSGEISVLGYYPNKLENAMKRRYAVVMGQKSQLFFELTPADTFLLFRDLYGLDDGTYRRNLDAFVELFGVRELLNVQVRTLSLGQRMMMELIAALLHGPEVLFLDEPTIGLDAVAQTRIREFLLAVNRERHTTILLTSHYMEDIRALCPRSVLIGHGQKLYDGETEALFERYQTHRIVRVGFAPGGAPEIPTDAEVLERGDDHMAFRVPRAETTAVMETLLRTAHPTDLTVEEDEIGRVVGRIYREMGVEEARE